MSNKKIGRVGPLTVLLILIFVCGIYFFTGNTRHPKSAVTILQTEAIATAVEFEKAKHDFPRTVDAITTLVNVEAEPNAIRYDEVASNDAPWKSWTNDSIKMGLLPAVCKNDFLLRLLDGGVNIEYYWTVTGSFKTFLTVFHPSDCAMSFPER